MNLHLPQLPLASVELQEFMAVQNRIVSAQNNAPCMGLVQDSLLASYLLTLNSLGIVNPENKDYENYDFNDKLVIYLEVLVFPNMNVFELKELFYNNPIDNFYYPNEYGLLFFNTLIQKLRKEKGIDVDFQRRQIILNYFNRKNINVNQLYIQLGNFYQKIWKNVKQYNEYEESIKKLFYMKGSCYNNEEFSNTFESYSENIVSNIFRPFINTLILKIKNDLKNLNAFIFIVGGDAMRRYDYNISKTKDIDTKIYIKGNIENKVEKIVIDNVSKFIYYMICIKSRLLENKTLNLKGGTLTFNSVLNDNYQFRLRKINKSDVFPIDLFSIDFRSQVLINYFGTNYIYKQDIPILDIVIEKNDKSENEVVNESKEGLPIASRKWILNDLDKTYHNKALAIGRLWGGKVYKDKKRYSFFKSNQVLTTNQELSKLNEIDELFLEYLNDNEFKGSKYYAELFRLGYNRKTLYRHKIPYNKKNFYKTFKNQKLIDMVIEKFDKCNEFEFEEISSSSKKLSSYSPINKKRKKITSSPKKLSPNKKIKK